MPNSYPEWLNFQFAPNNYYGSFFLHTLPLTIAFKLLYALFYQYYTGISTFLVKKCLVRLLLMTVTKHLAENDLKYWHHNVKTSRPRGQQLLIWGTVSSRYKYNLKLQATFGGIVETTGTGTETKTGFCITKTPRKMGKKSSVQGKIHKKIKTILLVVLHCFIQKRPMRKCLGTQWHLTAKPAPAVWSSWTLNSTEILCPF